MVLKHFYGLRKNYYVLRTVENKFQLPENTVYLILCMCTCA